MILFYLFFFIHTYVYENQNEKNWEFSLELFNEHGTPYHTIPFQSQQINVVVKL